MVLRIEAGLYELTRVTSESIPRVATPANARFRTGFLSQQAIVWICGCGPVQDERVKGESPRTALPH